MTAPPPREHDPTRAAEGTSPTPGSHRYPMTSAYLSLMVTLILLAVLFEWRL